MRKNDGDQIRLFNGKDGEWICALEFQSKKEALASPLQKIKEQSHSPQQVHAYFAPIKKNRMDFLIEKAVELGVTDLHPVLTRNTEVRKVNEERIRTQIIEAAEQCERLDIPTLHGLSSLTDILKDPPDTLYVALERSEGLSCQNLKIDNYFAFLVGPEGGFTNEEIKHINLCKNFKKLSLGDQILRAETATIKILSII